MCKSLIIIAGLALASPAFAQFTQDDLPPPTPRRGDPVYIRGMNILEINDYAEKHRTPVGREQNGNGFRNLTPRLQTASKVPQQVDLDKLRERKLAMYEERREFDVSLIDDSQEPAQLNAEHKASEPVAPHKTPLWRWIVFAGLILTSLGLAKGALSRD